MALKTRSHAVRAAGVSQADIDKMMKRNPARLLGLAEQRVAEKNTREAVRRTGQTPGMGGGFNAPERAARAMSLRWSATRNAAARSRNQHATEFIIAPRGAISHWR